MHEFVRCRRGERTASFLGSYRYHSPHPPFLVPTRIAPSSPHRSSAWKVAESFPARRGDPRRHTSFFPEIVGAHDAWRWRLVARCPTSMATPRTDVCVAEGCGSTAAGAGAGAGAGASTCACLHRGWCIRRRMEVADDVFVTCSSAATASHAQVSVTFAVESEGPFAKDRGGEVRVSCCAKWRETFPNWRWMGERCEDRVCLQRVHQSRRKRPVRVLLASWESRGRQTHHRSTHRTIQRDGLRGI